MSTSSTSSASSVASFYTSGGVTRLNGSELISGLDTQSLITALTAKTQAKIDSQGQLEQKAQWKQQMYQAIESLMVSFNSTYFSYADTSTNIMSAKFFDSGALTSSSSAVSATGASSAAGNVVINSIDKLASAASVASGYAPSEKNITSGVIRTEWTQSALAGKSLTVSYGGNDYTLTLDSSATLDSYGTAQENLQSIADALNRGIDANSSLSGKLQFSVTGDDASGYSLALSTTSSAASQSIQIKADASDSDASEAFLTAIGFPSGSVSDSGSITGSTDTKVTAADSPLFNHTLSSSSSLTLFIGGTSYDIKLGKDIDLTAGDAMDQLQTALNKQIAANSNLSGVSVSIAGGTFQVTGATVAGGSQNLLTGLGLQSSAGGPISSSGTVDTTKLAESYLGDTLAGSTLTVQLNGVSKTITFNSTDEASYSDAEGLQSYLQAALDKAYGTGKVTVGRIDQTDGEGHIVSQQLTFATSDPTSIFAMSSSSVSNVLNENGALRIDTGETNRLETTKTLNELKGELGNTLKASTADGEYTMSVNGKSFTFSGDTELGTVISTINSDPDAGVNITYSQTLNQFRVTADDTGSQGQISIHDVGGGNLAESLFGVDYSQVGAVQSADLTATDGKYSTGGGDSVYTFTLSGGTAQSVTIAGNKTYGSMDDLASAVQSAIDANGSLKGQIAVGVSSDGSRLTFDVAPGAASGTTLTVAGAGGEDVLGIGSAQTTKSVGSLTVGSLSSTDLARYGITTGTDGDGNTVYTVGGTTVKGDASLSVLGYDGVTAGTDLEMTATLSGTSQTIERSTNSFTLDGVTLNVTDTFNTAHSADDKIDFTASDNVDDLYKKISDFVDAYNAIIDKVNTYATQAPYGLGSGNGTTEAYEPLTDAQKKEMTDDEITEWNEKAQQGLLQNDQTLDSILSDLRDAMERTVSSAGISLSSIGIETAAYDYTTGGKLEINETALKSALQSEPDRIEQLFTGTDGISSKVKSVLTDYVGEYGNSGILYDIAGNSSSSTGSSDQLDQQIGQYQDIITDLKSQLSDEQSYWQTKFSAMETKLSTLNSQYTYLSSMLGGTSSSS